MHLYIKGTRYRGYMALDASGLVQVLGPQEQAKQPNGNLPLLMPP